MKFVTTIERMSYGPDAIAYLPTGKVVFVADAAPGDSVRLELTEEKKSFARARVVELIEPSPVRVCGDCPQDTHRDMAPWQHLCYTAQLDAKRANVVGALTHTAHKALDVAEKLVVNTIPSTQEWGYRNKLEMAVQVDTDKHPKLGFFAEGTHEVCALDECLLAHQEIQTVPRALRGALRFIQGTQDLGIFRIGVRHSSNTGDYEVALWSRPGHFPRALFAKVVNDALGKAPTSIVRVLSHSPASRKVKGCEVLCGRGFWREVVADVCFSTSAPSFFQVNTEQATRLVSEVSALLDVGKGCIVADLYAGGGTFSVPLAQSGATVIAVESQGISVKDLRRNARAHNVDIDIIGGDAARELSSLDRLDALVVDPPRAGLAPELPRAIAEVRPERVVYVSCNVATWARDVERLAHVGYHLKRVIPVDLFPQTYHIETASLFMHK